MIGHCHFHDIDLADDEIRCPICEAEASSALWFDRGVMDAPVRPNVYRCMVCHRDCGSPESAKECQQLHAEVRPSQ